ncbi:MAG: tyrosine-type recombinase/integrase [Chitinispirillia bacterium]|jgi:site-specific recombinase XerD
MTPLREKMIQDMQLQRLSERTQESYIYNIKQLSLHFNKSPEALNTDQIKTYMLYLTNQKKYAPNTLNQHLNAIRFLWVHTLQREWTLDKTIKRKRPKKLPVVLNKQEVQQLLLSVYNESHRMALTLMYYCGLRCSEVLNLSKEDIDLTALTIHIKLGKGKKDRILPLPDHLKKPLKDFMSHTIRKYCLFPSKRNTTKPVNNSTLERVMQTCLKQCGIEKKATPHSLRHAYATHLIENGIDIRIIQKLLGHKSISTTLVYTHVTNTATNVVRSVLDNALAPK